MEEEHLAQVACECLNLSCPQPDLKDWTAMIDAWKHPEKDVTIALVGKYTQLHDAYISVVEALKHGAVANRAQVHIKWIDSENVNPENVEEQLGDVSGILVPGGFGDRGIDGMICAIRYAREHKVPFLGLCLGMQLSIVEFARDVIGWNDAHSVELDPTTTCLLYTSRCIFLPFGRFCTIVYTTLPHKYIHLMLHYIANNAIICTLGVFPALVFAADFPQNQVQKILRVH